MGVAVHVPTEAAKRPTPSFIPSRPALLQRRCDGPCECGCDGGLEEEALHRRAAGPEPGGVPAIVHDVLGSPGQPLDAPARTSMEAGFGHDFGGVRIHADARAAESARAVNALAYTVGSDIVFGPGRYAPATSSGRELLAHELVHVLQSGEGHPGLRRRPTAISSPADPAEREADELAGRACGAADPVRPLVPAGPARLLRQWDAPGAGECPGADPDLWLEKVVVDQEESQAVTLHWSDGHLDSGAVSTGKGHCCVDPKTPEGVACTVAGSRVNGSNCTPITEGPGHRITDRYRSYNGWLFWSTFVPARGIGLHQHHTVRGKALSHGCVRMEKETARRIFCGARQNRTRVEVRGFARPRCDDPAVQREWEDDFATAGARATDGETPQARQLREKNKREARRMLRQAFGRELSEEEIDAGLASLDIPRCSGRAALPTNEEALLLPGSRAEAGEPTIGVRLLERSGFEDLLPPFTGALASARGHRRAQQIVRQHGRGLWDAATRRAQGTSAEGDDRPLYWARLQMARALRQWEPRFTLRPDQRAALLELFERASRGMETAAFRATDEAKRILISGFDPFDLTTERGRANPSGAAALALDGRRISSGGATAEIQSAVFPVRFADFDAGMVESFFRPFLSGPSPADMIMTISQGAPGKFEVEEFAGRRRSAAFPDNLAVAPGTPQRPVEPPGLAAGPEFLRGTLPASARRSLGRTSPTAEESTVVEIPSGGSRAVERPAGPTAGSTAVEGSGGGFLSNEIFYRTSLLRLQTGAAVPVGHLHIPRPAAGLTPPQLEADRTAIVRRIEQILVDVLPDL